MKQNFQRDAMNPEEEMNAQDEPMMLMSLALDGLLSDAEDAHLQKLLEDDQGLALIWEDWQRMDGRFSDVGRVLPPVDFVQQFEVRLAQQQSKQLWWSNLFVVIAALVIWGGLLTGGLFMAYNAYANQAALMSEFVHSFTGMAASTMQWLRALRIALTTVTSSPQTVGLMIGYVCAAGAALLWWVQFLRHNTEVVEAQQLGS